MCVEMCYTPKPSPTPMNKIDNIVSLIRKHLSMKKGETLIDRSEVLTQHPDLEKIVDRLDDRQKLLAEYATYHRIRMGSQDRQQQMLQDILTRARREDDRYRRRVRRLTVLKVSGVAASICICLGMLYWQMGMHVDPIDNRHAISEFAEIKPGHNSANLKIQGMQRSIELKSSEAGIVIDQHIQYADGGGLIQVDEKIAANPIMELTTPKGGEYQITLSDGTQVTLNADSKLIYPRSFRADQRVVELTGEAYFEVAKRKGAPFIVKTLQQDVQVLGTHFNVNAYADEARSYVSLIEGSVKVSKANLTKLLIPGQQTMVDKGNMSVQKMNVDEVLAWKRGEFMFNNENMESVMLKLSRWYNIEIIVSSELKELSIWGSVSRYDSFDKVLDIIKIINDKIKFRKEGRRVYIMK